MIHKRNKLNLLSVKDEGNAKKEDSILMQRIKIDQAITIAKKILSQNFADCFGDSRQVFQILKEVTCNRVQSWQLSSLEVNGFELYDYTEIASAFNHRFASVGPKLAQSLSVKKPPKTDQRSHESMDLFKTNKNQRLEVLQQLS